MASLLLDINSNTNQFVDLQCIVFKKLLVVNADSEAINIDLAIGKSNSAGATSLTEGTNVLQAIKIPTGVTLCIDGLDFTSLVGTTVNANALQGEDYTFLIRATATDKLYNIFIEY